MVFKNHALYPHMSVFENIGFALKLAKEVKLLEALGAELVVPMAIDARPAAVPVATDTIHDGGRFLLGSMCRSAVLLGLVDPHGGW